MYKKSDEKTMDLNPVRGTRDFFPDELRLRNWLFAHFREVARQFNFQEYDAPVLESEALYVRKAGEEITQQLYNFEDKGGRKVALRPEMTPSLARLILQKGKSLSLPVKWFSIPQCWRYERMTRGRKREHYQWNMDVFGVESVVAEAELIAALIEFFRRVGLNNDQIMIRVSSRKVIQSVVDMLGVPADKFAAVCVLVDKLEKVPREAIADDMNALGIESAVVDRIIEVMLLRSLDDLAAALGDDNAAVRELRQLFDLVDGYDGADWLRFDASIIRGLAYYTGTVFEAFDKGPGLRAVCGGGRYDRLLSTFGGTDLPACGFGFGDVVILELLQELKLIPDLPATVDDVVFAFDETLLSPARQVARQLRRTGRSVDMVLTPKKLKWVLKHAGRIGASRVVFLAPQEWEQKKLNVRILDSGDEKQLTIDDLLKSDRDGA